MEENTGRTVIITGGTKGIGAAIAHKFHKEGDTVIIGARTDNGIADNLGERAYFLKTDVSDKSAHEALVRLAIEKTGKLDVYINCAGFSQWHPIEEIEESFLNKMIDVNLKGLFFGCQAAALNMKSKGVIINISSLAGKRGSANNSVYCATKFAVNGITQSLAKELGPKGIRVNAVCPVYVKTDGVLDALTYKHSPAGGEDVEKYLEMFTKSSTALGTLPTGEEVADFCFYLSTSSASAITGQCVNVDCGVLPQ